MIVLAKHFYMYIKKVLVKVQIKKKSENIYIYFGQKKILFCFIYPLLMLIMMFVTISTKIATKWYITCLYLKKLIFVIITKGLEPNFPTWETWGIFLGGLPPRELRTLGKLRAKYQFYYIFSHKPWFSAFSTWNIK